MALESKIQPKPGLYNHKSKEHAMLTFPWMLVLFLWYFCGLSHLAVFFVCFFKELFLFFIIVLSWSETSLPLIFCFLIFWWLCSSHCVLPICVTSAGLWLLDSLDLIITSVCCVSSSSPVPGTETMCCSSLNSKHYFSYPLPPLSLTLFSCLSLFSYLDFNTLSLHYNTQAMFHVWCTMASVLACYSLSLCLTV